MALLERLQKDIKAPFEFKVFCVGMDYSDETTTVYLNVQNDVFDTYKDSTVCEHCGPVKENHPPEPPPARDIKGTKKPPLGVMKRLFWLETRLNFLHDVITRYREESLPIPSEWIEEHNYLLDEIVNGRSKKNAIDKEKLRMLINDYITEHLNKIDFPGRIVKRYNAAERLRDYIDSLE